MSTGTRYLTSINVCIVQLEIAKLNKLDSTIATFNLKIEGKKMRIMFASTNKQSH